MAMVSPPPVHRTMKISVSPGLKAWAHGGGDKTSHVHSEPSLFLPISWPARPPARRRKSSVSGLAACTRVNEHIIILHLRGTKQAELRAIGSDSCDVARRPRPPSRAASRPRPGPAAARHPRPGGGGGRAGRRRGRRGPEQAES